MKLAEHFVWPVALRMWSGWQAGRLAGRQAGRQAGWQADENLCFSDFLEIDFQHFSGHFLIYNVRNKVRNVKTL